MSKKEKFLEEHNKLSPPRLQATMEHVSRFRVERPKAFKDNEWSLDALRRPFILWLAALSQEPQENKISQ